MAPDLTPEQTAFLRDNTYYGVVSTVRRDGSPHASIVWVDVDDDGKPGLNSNLDGAKAKHVARDPRVTLIVFDPADAYHWVKVEGTAELVEEGADAQLDKLAKKYLGADTYPWRDSARTRVRVAITPKRIETAGFRRRLSARPP